jgi:hypothetical protein
LLLILRLLLLLILRLLLLLLRRVSIRLLLVLWLRGWWLLMLLLLRIPIRLLTRRWSLVRVCTGLCLLLLAISTRRWIATSINLWVARYVWTRRRLGI